MPGIEKFECLDDRMIAEINTRARLYRHKQTGAQVLSLENNDENKVFGITFRTPVSDSTGVPHIMEHSVLCGSRKYPVKEPFVELVKGSLNTFLNAMTYPDKTCYPVASQNLKDFYNLVDVYLDAVFYPLIEPQTLLQEGWHYELEDLAGEMSYKGVVFNEMKGAYSSPDSMLYQQTQHFLFPQTTYGFDSGGDPRRIPDLTYQQFKQFHNTYYHPANARIYFYGDDDPEERLRILDAYLGDFNALQVNSTVSLQQPFEQPQKHVVPYQAEENGDGGKSFVSVNWLLPETGRAELMLGLSILSHILLGMPASPLRKALIESRLGDDLVGGGLDTELRQMYFSTGLKGTEFANSQQVEDLISQTLASLSTEGIDPDTVAASVNTIEFRLRENNTGSFPRGLSLMLRALTTWLHDGDPMTSLAFETPLNAIKSRLEAGEAYFENLIRSYFLKNMHRVTVILQPDPGVSARQEADEKERLAAVRQRMTAEDLEQVVETTRELKERQEAPNSPEALATIPMLKLADLDRLNKQIPMEIVHKNGVEILLHDLFTNGIVYLDLGMDLHALPQDLVPLVPLFGRSLLEIGTRRDNYVRLSQRIGGTTGGIRSTTFTSAVRETRDPAAWLFLRGKSTLEHAPDLLDILRDVLLDVHLDNRERFLQMVLEEKADLEAQLVPMGHRIVNSRLRSRFDLAGWASDQFNGISSLFYLRHLALEVEKDWPAVLGRLEQLRDLLVNRSTMLANVTLDQNGWQHFGPALEDFLEALPSQKTSPATWKLAAQDEHEGLAIPAQVNYVGKGINLFDDGYQLDGSILVIGNYVRNSWLWDRVRVQGGAYGAFFLFDHRSGVLTWISYRDPNLLATLENFDGSGSFLINTQLTPDELVKNIIGVIGDLDAYQLPDAKGYSSMLRHLAGETEESRQQLRDQILSTSSDDFRRLGELLEAVKDQGRVVVLGSPQAIEAANADHPGLLALRKVM